jgi:hypothetical protein
MTRRIGMDLLALVEILRRKFGEDVRLTPGSEYSIEISLEEAISILGEEPPEMPTGFYVKLRGPVHGKYEVITERHQIN